MKTFRQKKETGTPRLESASWEGGLPGGPEPKVYPIINFDFQAQTRRSGFPPPLQPSPPSPFLSSFSLSYRTPPHQTSLFLP